MGSVGLWTERRASMRHAPACLVFPTPCKDPNVQAALHDRLPRGEDSESKAAADAFLSAYRERHVDLEVDVLNLWEDQLPVYGGRGVAAKMAVFGGGAPSDDDAKAWADVQRVFARFDAADSYLFAVPMWNAGVPWVLKHFIDTITQPGMTFGFDPEAGYTPL